MPNMATIIQRNSNNVLRDGKQASEDPADAVCCKCREKDSCPFDGACHTRSFVYKATIKTDDEAECVVAEGQQSGVHHEVVDPQKSRRLQQHKQEV